MFALRLDGTWGGRKLTGLIRVLLDAISRRHEAQKIFERQAAAQGWIQYRDQILQGSRPNSMNSQQLRACDHQLRLVSPSPSILCARGGVLTLYWQDLAGITDEVIYSQLRASDQAMGRWTAEDPSLSSIQLWLRARR